MSYEISGPWRLKRSRYGVHGPEGYGLLGEKCLNCQKIVLPPRDVCPACNHECKNEYVVLGKGTVYSFSTIFDAAPSDFENQIPYTMAIIELNAGPRITAMLTDVATKDIFIGMPVEMVVKVLREQGDKGPIDYGMKFRPNMILEITGWMDLLRTRFREYDTLIALSSR